MFAARMAGFSIDNRVVQGAIGRQELFTFHLFSTATVIAKPEPLLNLP